MNGPCFPTAESGECRCTALFDQPRKGHVHAGLDVLGPRGVPWRAIWRGEVWHQVTYKPDKDYDNDGVPFPYSPWRNYRFEIYGALAILYVPERNETYVYAHGDPSLGWPISQVFSQKKDQDSFAVTYATRPVRVEAGEVIGEIGWAGQCLWGPVGSVVSDDPRASHLHIEGHKGRNYTRHDRRIRIEDLFPGKCDGRTI